MKMSLFHLPEGGHCDALQVAGYDLRANEARFGPGEFDGPVLLWVLGDCELNDPLLACELDFDVSRDWVLRCDRVDFPPGGIAYEHTHPGPGIRCLIKGTIEIQAEGHRNPCGPLEPWFEAGPDPVVARASVSEDSAFVRAMLVPAELTGKRTITYVNPADEEKPKLQTATIFFDAPVSFQG